MVYFIRARTHYHYAQLLLKELSEGKRKEDPALYREIFTQGLKALYALTEVNPQTSGITLEVLLQKVLPTLSSEEKSQILELKTLLFSESGIKFKEPELREKIKAFLELVRRCLEPIL